jgi:uracil-DNA glycosylase family 4
MPVPNEQPTITLPYRLAIVGDYPEQEEINNSSPFVGTAGRMLWGVSSQLGIMRGACLVANVCQETPELMKNDFCSMEQQAVFRGKAALAESLAQAKPNAVLLVGDLPLKLAGVEHPVSDYRGSIFQCRETSSPLFGYKCVATVHPRYVMKNYEMMPMFSMDIKRAKDEALTSEFTPPPRTLEVELTSQQIIERLDAITPGTFVSIDIEGGIESGISCVGVATSATNAFIVNIRDFTLNEQVRIFPALGRVLMDASIPKILQNSLYDNFCLTWLWKMPIRNVAVDTMLTGWEIYPELPKGLGTQTSIWTKEPYYKFQRKTTDQLTHYRYCCTDAAVTYEIAQKHISAMTSKATDTEAEKNRLDAMRKHAEFNISLLPPLLYMELRGIRYDRDKARSRCDEINVTMSELKARFDSAATMPINPNCNNGANSLANILYKKLGFEPQYKKEHGRRTTTLTADVEALLQLGRTDTTGIIRNILKWRVLEGQRKQLEIEPDKDGRIRCGYNLVGTETGRMSCYESPTGNGTNLQTIMKANRDLFVADDGYEFFQCDLSGADGWTVAAHCASLGDDTMLRDYHAGIKPARVIAAMYTHGYSIANLPIPDLKEAIKRTAISEALYFTCKRVQHGSNYMMKKNTMSTVILKDFWKLNGEINYVTPKDCEALQNLYLKGRYKSIVKWHERTRDILERTAKLGSASGHVRTFFGRRGDLETIKSALSHEPQANTTYATNIVMSKLWNDPENRIGGVVLVDAHDTYRATKLRTNGGLIIEPFHQVHDAICGQWPKDRTEWAKKKLYEYFNNPLVIAGQDILIPFEGHYGPSWGEQPHTI